MPCCPADPLRGIEPADAMIHRLMVGDLPRTTAYQEAINRNKHLFHGKTVMDVGAGTGILSLFAAAAGATKVYAVEASGTAQLVNKVAKQNGFDEVISVLNCKVEDVELPSGVRIDVMVSEWMGFYLFHESMLNSVLAARDRFLAEDGVMFPSEARLYACPCSLQGLYEEKITFWNNVFGFDMSAVGSSVLDATAKKPEVCVVKQDDLLAQPVCIKTIDLRWVETNEITKFSENTFVSITKRAPYHGLCLWFECDFNGLDYNENGDSIGELVTLSTSPFSAPTHWKQTVVTLGAAGTERSSIGPEDGLQTDHDIADDTIRTKSKFIEVEEDEVIGWRLEFEQSESNARHYTITLQMLDPEEDEHPEPCSCGMARCLIIAKLIENEMQAAAGTKCNPEPVVVEETAAN
ncbi:protein arginine N-methyltransferase 1-like isoform X3 [Hyalella azteca]|uniref:type I protein arginine methyltransferase n=1 Tax=Hyalella azteca TaxID=294128 RepID=A0A8B7NZX7_HYAAZ|nr:protein arginine N-methyltransferase 1-like isoform X3 [Hyalella azteca]